MRSSNPVLTRLTPETQRGYAPGPSGYQQTPTYQSPVAYGTTDRMTVDDVVVRTVGLLGLTGIAGALAWALVPESLMGPVWILSAMVGLVLGLIISFKRITNPPVLFAYAIVEGVFVGVVSKAYNAFANGIVIQAVAATFGIFLVMAVLYKSRAIRATPRFARILTGAVVGVLAIYLVSWVLRLFTNFSNPLFERTSDGKGTWLAIGFSLVVIVIASLTFILDFDLIEQSVAQGAPKEMAWTCAFGLLVGLIWVYLEVLRLLSYLRGRD